MPNIEVAAGVPEPAPSPVIPAIDSSVLQQESSIEKASYRGVLSEIQIDRKINYDGHITSRATSPEEIIEQAINMTLSLDGYVEQRSNNLVIVRVPVENFKPLYQQLLGLADVIQREISTEDITDLFVDRELRLRTSKVARDRLIKLLTKATEEKEKITLLVEIQRLNQQIEALEAEIKTLEKLASLSKITFHVHPRQSFSNTRRTVEDISFQWINLLSPFDPMLYSGFEPLMLSPPQEMVELEHDRYWAAESADGTVLRSYQRANNPRGDTEFWKKAILHRVAPEFEEVTEMSADDYIILRFLSRSDEPYIYWVGIKTVDNKLHVMEGYFPRINHENRYGDSIKVILKEKK